MKHCAACDEPITDGVCCSVCKHELHFHCAGITENGYRKLGDRKHSWRCGKCKTSSAGQPPLSPRIESEMLKEIRAISEKLAPLESLRDEIMVLRTEFSDLKSSLSQTHKELKEFNSKLKDIEMRLKQAESVQKQVTSIQDRLDKLEQESHAKDQWSRSNNVEIKGVPQKNHENLFEIVNQIGNRIGYSISKTQINFVTGVPTREKSHSKPIILSFCSRYVKEDFISAARLTNKAAALTTAQIGLPENHRIYVNDHLTIHNKLLLAKTKKTASDLGFRYVWVKNATIHARKDDTSHIIIVKTEKDIEKLK